ncbi:MAG: hypothetical protein LPK47_06585, partial [Bacteroidota bacterium]|nr:hypothetical protein [Bacteroidota bacterium]
DGGFLGDQLLREFVVEVRKLHFHSLRALKFYKKEWQRYDTNPLVSLLPSVKQNRGFERSSKQCIFSGRRTQFH